MFPLHAMTRRRFRRPLLAALAAPAILLPALLFALPEPGKSVRALAVRKDASPPEPLIAILCYHDVSDDPLAKPDVVSPEELRKQIRGARESGWTILPLSELLARRERPETLPPRTLVLTFDDGYGSFHEKALPVLREEGVKATIAIVDSFIDRPPPGMPPLLTWEQIREAERSGFAEVASHSHGLHRYEVSNPYRDTAASVTTRRYLLAERRYEDRDEYRERIRADLKEARRVLKKRLGHDVSVLAWPYGEHTAMARALAAREGFAATLGYEGTFVAPEDLREGYLPRVPAHRGMDMRNRSLTWLFPPRRPVRAVQVDLDAVYDPDPKEYDRRLVRLVAKARGTGATHVFLQACPDPAGDGRYREAWFMNHQLPVRADIWSMAAHRFFHAGLAVWIRAPSLNLSWEWERHPEWRIPVRNGSGGKIAPWYFRLSPDVPEARRAAIDFFTDIAVYLPIQGILFDDDAFLLEEERLRQEGTADPEAKSAAIRSYLEAVKEAVLAWRPECEFGRNLYAPAAERDGVHPRFSQDMDQFLADYDLTVVMAYTRMEGHRRDGERWIRSLARKAKARWERLDGRALSLPPVMLKLQAYDWSREEWIPGKEMTAMAAAARDAGLAQLGVYPVLPEEGDLPPDLFFGGRDPFAHLERRD